MKYIALVLIVLCTGCMTTYEISKETPEGTIVVSVRSFREFEQPKVHYKRSEDSVTFDFNAESATTGVSPVEQAFADGIRAGAIVLNPVPGGNQ